MAVDAGTISSGLRLKLDLLAADIEQAGYAFDNLGKEFTRSANEYSNIGGKKYKAALKSIETESKNVEKAVKTGAITQQDALNRLIKLRKEELQVMQNRVVKEGKASEESVKAINRTKQALEKLEEQQRLLGSDKDGSLLSTFQKMQAVMQGPVAAFSMVKNAVVSVAQKFDELETMWTVQEKAIRLVEATLRATGAAAWISKDEVLALSEELEALSGVGKEEIRTMETVLLGFKNIKGDNFKEAALQIMNMATVMEMDLTSAAQAVGKALDDPVAGINSLTRQGFRFSESQKTLLESMVATGHIAEAQKIILDELATTYGGAAEAAGSTATAVKTKLGAAIDGNNEQIGRYIANSLKPWREWLLKIASANEEALKNINDIKEANKAVEQGNETFEQRLVYLKQQKFEMEQLLSTLYVYDEVGNKIETEEYKRTKARINIVKEGIATTEKAIIQRDKAAKEKYDQDAKVAEEAKKQAERDEATLRQIEGRKKAEQEYNSAVNKTNEDIRNGLLTVDKANEQNISSAKKYLDALYELGYASEKEIGTIGYEAYQKVLKIVQESINLSETLRDARLKESDVTRNNVEKQRTYLQSLIDEVINLGKVEETGVEKTKQAAIEKIKLAGFVKEQEDELIAKVEEYYEKLQDKEASQAFLKNISTAIDSASTVMNSWFGLMTVINDSIKEQELERLDKETEALEEALAERQELEDEYLEDRQEREQEAFDERYESLLSALDAELQAELFARGLVGAATVEQYQAELDAAIATGDAIKIKEAQDALDRAVLEKQYSDQRLALEEQEAAEKAKIEERQAQEKKDLEERQAAEKEELTKQQARKEAQIEYEYRLESWQMQLAQATATAAQAVLNAYMSAAAVPITGWLTAPVAAGIAGAAGALNVATVVASRPKAPSFKTGGSFVVPDRYKNDSFGMPAAWLDGGETVHVIPKGKEQIGTNIVIQGNIYGGKAGLRELNRELSNVMNLEKRRRG